MLIVFAVVYKCASTKLCIGCLLMLALDVDDLLHHGLELGAFCVAFVQVPLLKLASARESQIDAARGRLVVVGRRRDGVRLSRLRRQRDGGEAAVCAHGIVLRQAGGTRHGDARARPRSRARGRGVVRVRDAVLIETDHVGECGIDGAAVRARVLRR